MGTSLGLEQGNLEAGCIFSLLQLHCSLQRHALRPRVSDPMGRQRPLAAAVGEPRYPAEGAPQAQRTTSLASTRPAWARGILGLEVRFERSPRQPA